MLDMNWAGTVNRLGRPLALISIVLVEAICSGPTHGSENRSRSTSGSRWMS
jgi:hypothetical protein